MPFHGGEILIPDVSLHNFLWERCLARGDKIFMIDNTMHGKSMTYKEIYEQSRTCAAFLIEKGVKIGDVVGLCAPSSIEFVVAMLGIIGSGATVMPCNPEYSEGEILHQFRIGEPKVVIVHASAAETIKKATCNLPCVKDIYVIGHDDKFTTLQEIVQSRPDLKRLDDVIINPLEDVVLLPYSSGTTGLPKSVMLTHRNLVSMMVIYQKNSERSFFDEACAYMDRPMYHGGGFGPVFFSLTAGIKGVIEKEFNVDTMLKAIEKYKVTHLVTVPPVLIQLVNDDVAYAYDTSSLKIITAAGSAMAPDILQRLVNKFHVSMLPAYGLTEAGTVSVSRDPRTPLNSCGAISVGVEVKIVHTETDEELGVEEDGEILVRGPQVMKGYLKDPRATAIALEQDGWLHTGDVGHVNKDGLLYVVDRIKEVIKYKSLQVPPAELESVILEHPKVADVGVIGIPDPEVGELPKAFVVKKNDSLTKQEVIEYVQGHLVDYKHLRGGVEFVTAIPRSQTGKIQRKELKKIAGINE